MIKHLSGKFHDGEVWCLQVKSETRLSNSKREMNVGNEIIIQAK